MEKFVCVRIVRVEDLDLSVFQFDPDLTFAVFLMNSDKTVYGRFGTRSDFVESDRDISLVGLRKAMITALDLHDNYPSNKTIFSAKTGSESRFKTLTDYPWAKQRRFHNCAHCHHLGTSKHLLFRLANKPIPDKVLFPFPMPDLVGLKMDPKEKATVKQVLPNSAAKRAELLPGDEILTLQGQPILSTADVQWILHNAGRTAQLNARILRDGHQRNVTLSLDVGWRNKVDVSWRATTGMLRRHGLGGMRLEELSGAERKNAGVSDRELALRVQRLFRNSAAEKAGIRRSDVLVTFDGERARMSESELLAYSLRNTMPGAKVPVTVLRSGRRISIDLPVE